MAVGLAAWRLGAGRAKQGDPVQAAAGVTWHAGVGDQVRAGQPLFELHTDTAERIERAKQAISGAVQIGAEAPTGNPVVLERIS
jgi:thymidine phosphorylase